MGFGFSRAGLTKITGGGIGGGSMFGIGGKSSLGNPFDKGINAFRSEAIEDILSGYNSASKLQEDSQAFSREKGQNAHQWEVQDLIKAGLNPVLSAGGASAGAIAGSASPTASASSGMGSVLSSIPSLISAVSSARANVAQAELYKKQAEAISLQNEPVKGIPALLRYLVEQGHLPQVLGGLGNGALGMLGAYMFGKRQALATLPAVGSQSAGGQQVSPGGTTTAPKPRPPVSKNGASSLGGFLGALPAFVPPALAMMSAIPMGMIGYKMYQSFKNGESFNRGIPATPAQKKEAIREGYHKNNNYGKYRGVY